MRNTPFPRHSIGRYQHAFFPVGDCRGLIQGIEAISESTEIGVSDLPGFDLLPASEIVQFEEGATLEIVEFTGYAGRDGFTSQLKARRVQIELGGKLTGPVAWRVSESKVDSSVPEGFSTGEIVGLALLALFMGSLVFALYVLAPDLFGPVVWAGSIVTALVGGVVYSMSAYGRWKRRSIARMGSVWVYSPVERLWAGRTTETA